MFCGKDFVNDQTIGKLVADIAGAFRTVCYASLDHARSHRTRLVNKARVIGHASIAGDLLSRYPESEILVPTVAEDLLIGGISFDIRTICKT
jgi:hypothetical protein